MSDLADIAAAAGIAIVDTPCDGGDMGHSDNARPSSISSAVVPDGSGDTGLTLELETFDMLFSRRYTEEDPDYAKTVAESEANSHPPCVEAYFGRRQRDSSQSWQRDRNYRNQHHDGRGHRGRGDFPYRGHWNQNRNYGRDRQIYGDNQNRDRHYRDRSPR